MILSSQMLLESTPRHFLSACFPPYQTTADQQVQNCES